IFGSALVVLGLVGAVVEPVVPGVAAALFRTAGLVLWPGIALVRTLAKPAWAAVDVPIPSLLELALVYGLLAALLWLPRRGARRAGHDPRAPRSLGRHAVPARALPPARVLVDGRPRRRGRVGAPRGRARDERDAGAPPRRRRVAARPRGRDRGAAPAGRRRLCLAQRLVAHAPRAPGSDRRPPDRRHRGACRGAAPPPPGAPAGGRAEGPTPRQPHP